MLKIKDVKISKNPCKTNEKIVISVDIEETLQYPHKYPHKYPVYFTGPALPEGE